MAIDWDDYMKTYNRQKQTNFKNHIEWLKYLYDANGGFVNPLAELMGVGHHTMTRTLEKYNLLKRKPKGGKRVFDRTGIKEKAFISISEMEMKGLTRNQICERCGIGYSTFHRLDRKFKREYKRIHKEKMK